MQTSLLTKPLTLKNMSVPNADIEIQSVSLQTVTVEISIDNVTGGLIDNDLKVELLAPGYSAKILDNVVIIERDTPESMSAVFNFSQGDIENGKLIRTHNFNQIPVDVSVSDNLNKEILIGVDYPTSNTISLDFSRVTVNGVWRVLIEK